MTTRGRTRDQYTDQAADAAIVQACRILHLPSIRSHYGQIATTATRQQASYKAFLVELLSVECEERQARRRTRLVREANLPRTKRLEDFDFDANPNVPAALIHTLAKGAWIQDGQPVCLIGDSGTGKSHLLIGLGTAAEKAAKRLAWAAHILTADQIVLATSRAAWAEGTHQLVEQAVDMHWERGPKPRLVELVAVGA